jgi:hypothetical protein
MQSGGAVWERDMYNKIWSVIYVIFVVPERGDDTLREREILGHSLVDQKHTSNINAMHAQRE